MPSTTITTAALAASLFSALATAQQTIPIPGVPILIPTAVTLAASVITATPSASQYVLAVNCLDATCSGNPPATVTANPTSYAFRYTSGTETTAYTCPLSSDPAAVVSCTETYKGQTATNPYTMSDLTGSGVGQTVLVTGNAAALTGGAASATDSSGAANTAGSSGAMATATGASGTSGSGSGSGSAGSSGTATAASASATHTGGAAGFVAGSGVLAAAAIFAGAIIA